MALMEPWIPEPYRGCLNISDDLVFFEKHICNALQLSSADYLKATYYDGGVDLEKGMPLSRYDRLVGRKPIPYAI